MTIRPGGEVVTVQETATPGTEVTNNGEVENQLTQIMVQMKQGVVQRKEEEKRKREEEDKKEMEERVKNNNDKNKRESDTRTPCSGMKHGKCPFG